MSRASTGSTSSTPTPGSWSDLAKLGEYILDQLGRDRRSDQLLVRWVAHRLAEHMSAAETADDPGERQSARDAGALLIAQLWQARGGWPYGWPPDTAREFTDGVAHAAGRSYGAPSVRLPPWLSTLAELEALLSEERATWVNAGLLEGGAAELRRALDAAPDGVPEPTDLAEIRWQVRRFEEAEDWIASHARDGEDPSRREDRARILGRVLADIADRRQALVGRTLADTRRGQRRKPRRSTGVGARRTRRTRSRPGGANG